MEADPEAIGAVQTALRALSDQAEAGRTAAPESSRATGARVAEGWFTGLALALGRAPLVSIDVGPDGMDPDGIQAASPEDRCPGLAAALYKEGVRGLVIEQGSTRDELVALAWVLMWAGKRRRTEDPTLELALWEADLSHVQFQLAERPGPGEASNRSDHPSLARLNQQIVELAEAPRPSERTRRLTGAQFEHLTLVRGTLPPEPGALRANVTVDTRIPGDISDDVLAVREGRDLADADVGGTLAACLRHESSAARARTLTEAIMHHALDALGSGSKWGSFAHRALELLDPELTPEFRFRDEARAAFATFSEDPFRVRLSRILSQPGIEQSAGPVYSLMGLAAIVGVGPSIAEISPPWAIRCLADAMLVRETVDATTMLDRVRKRLHHQRVSEILIGLALAARLDEARLMEPALAHADHADARVRAAVLHAVRRQKSPRIRELARKRLDDDDEEVRVEAMRGCVAHRDLEAGPRLESRLSDPRTGSRSETEVRAICIAVGRLQRDAAIEFMVGLATGTRHSPHPAIPRLALVGIKSAGGDAARRALESVAVAVPTLAEEARTLAKST